MSVPDGSLAGASPHLFLITGSLECGGSERQLADMANYWAAKGFDVTVATWAGPGTRDCYSLDARVERVHLDSAVGGRLRGNLARIRKLRRVLEASRPCSVLSFLTRSNVPAILASRGLPARVVISERTQPAYETGLQAEWRLLRRLVYGQADALVCQTRATADWIWQHWGQRTEVIANALRPLPTPPERREPFILGVGRLVDEKGFDLLLQSYARIFRRLPEWRVVIAGSGPQRATFEMLAADLAIGGRVEFLGHVEDIEAWMGRAGLVVQPSRFEGFPNAVLEAMGMGAAVISADCPAGPAELIQDGVNGRLVPVEDVEALAQAMTELISTPELRSRLGHEAQKVRERFRQDKVMAQWEAVLLPR